ncbi:MAG TPA: serine/threonine-protein kinase, partial [Kofleriaceae bacterium]|nr:serine/threonine-protein kinase [Kofleriaceae bacterium]
MGESDDLGHDPTVAQPVVPGVELVGPPEPEVERYRSEGPLGQGGMGVVSLLYDKRIGRRVAAKGLRPELAGDATTRARFLREAQVQGQLEHPAVVPVYDIGSGADGTPYFTMKSVRGVTLRGILDGLREGSAELAAKYTRHRLLTAFGQVCLAVDYAHQRGIMHRDLKPANLMLGDYGEVYVLDWGVAKIRGASDEGLSISDDTPTPTAMTHVGALLGTPGYMAPEQLDTPSDVGPAADVYSLGAILFEMLTLQTLHPRTSVQENLASTREGAEARPSLRAPDRDPPPELDAVCARALALDPAARYGSARDLHEALQRYLMGERDLELRREQSAAHARKAAEAARMVAEGSVGTLESRRHAMRELSRALALDPDNIDAVTTMVHLLETPPAVTPPEVTFEQERAFRRDSRWIGGVGAVVYLSMIGFLPLLWWMGIRQPGMVAGFFGLLLLAAGLSVQVWRSKVPPLGAIMCAMLCSSLAFALAARFGSPALITPVALSVNATGYAIFVERRYRVLVTLVAVLCVAVPLILEQAGVLPRTITFEQGYMQIMPAALDLDENATMALVCIAGPTAIIMATLVVGHIRD